MVEKENGCPGAEVERSYAGVLERVSIGGVVLSILAYVLYVFHLLPLSVSVESIAGHWHVSADELASEGFVTQGWAWISHLPDADILSLAAVGLLTMTPVACLAVASLSFFRQKDYAYTIIAVLQIGALLVAASGVFTG
jgi:uncharacterized membrane protein